MNHIEKELQKIGLSDKEARVYLAAIELGASPVQKIAVKAGVNRATTYVMIESLIERGLMTSISNEKKRLFVAESPDSILALIKNEKDNLEIKEKSIQSILPELLNLSGSSNERPTVVVFEGHAGVERLRDLNRNSGIKAVEEFTSLDEAYRCFPPSESDHRQYFRKNHQIKFIYCSKKGIVLPTKEDGVERRRISYDAYPFDGDVSICGSRVSIIYYSPKLLGVSIEHQGIANTFHQMFLLAWNSLEKK